MQKFHGVTSLALVLIATVIAAVAMFQTSWLWGIGYIVIWVGGGAAIIYSFCTKCPCRTHCGHVFPGKLTQFFPSRLTGPYTFLELAVTILVVLLWIGLPQPWLWQSTGLFVAFWVLYAIAGVQIRMVVCPACNNVHCPARIRFAKDAKVVTFLVTT